MERLTIKKLIVISHSESSSLEVTFKKGLNIILGDNKTGKSSIIKSIFYTLGCELKKYEADWKKLISIYLLFFDYGEKSFCVTRQNKKFQIFEEEKNGFSCIIEIEDFHKYSNKLMGILGINMPCISNTGSKYNTTPPLLFRFQYIDQDEGWNKIADSFNNVKYIKDWKKNTNKYVCGYLDETYYDLQTEKAEYESKKSNKDIEYENNIAFVSRITSSMNRNEDIESTWEVPSTIESLLSKAEELRKEQYECNLNMSVLENDIYINQEKLRILRLNLSETEKDIEYARKQKDELVCPFCRNTVLNRLEEQLDLTSDYARCEKLITHLEESILNDEKKLENLKKEYNKTSTDSRAVEQKIRDSRDLLSYSYFYKNKGQQDIYKSCEGQLEALRKEIQEYSETIEKIGREMEEKKSRKRSQEIKSRIEENCKTLAKAVNLSDSVVKLKDFVQVIDLTGSDAPRLVYMYQSALYLYNLSRGKNPFSFLVIDTPNQQGQDEENLKSIFESLKLLLKDEGQVIVGTERETTIEGNASNVIKLTEKRRCLNKINYNDHVKLVEKLQMIAEKWVKSNNNVQDEK